MTRKIDPFENFVRNAENKDIVNLLTEVLEESQDMNGQNTNGQDKNSSCCISPKRSVPKTYTIKIVTPMFGGGVEAGVNDDTMLIRSTSVRGHLRFWWRATRGKAFDDFKEMRKRENEIWGSTETPSQVQIKVNVVQKGKTFPCAKYELNSKGKWKLSYEKDCPAYVLFPFQGTTNEDRTEVTQHPAKYSINILFEVSYCCPEELKSDVEAAFWAWTNFGGIGARTRRGCGSLFCEKISNPQKDEYEKFVPPNVQKLPEWFQQSLITYEIPTSVAPKEWPTIGDTLLVGKQNTDPMISWNAAIEPFRDFRQGKDMGRNPGDELNRPGRSRWPEPEAIREMTGQRFLPRHQKLKDHPTNVFPRAEFGLPIIVHFKDNGDPADTEIAPPQGDRMGSPLILKPLAMQGQQFVPLAFRFQTKPLERTKLKRGQNVLREGILVRTEEAANYRQSPMKDRTKIGSAIEAFLYYLTKNNFQEVSGIQKKEVSQ